MKRIRGADPPWDPEPLSLSGERRGDIFLEENALEVEMELEVEIEMELEVEIEMELGKAMVLEM